MLIILTKIRWLGSDMYCSNNELTLEVDVLHITPAVVPSWTILYLLAILGHDPQFS